MDPNGLVNGQIDGVTGVDDEHNMITKMIRQYDAVDCSSILIEKIWHKI